MKVFGGLMGDSHNTTTQPHKYIGKELDRAHGLDWYDHGARDDGTQWMPWRRNTTHGRTMSVHHTQMLHSQKKWEDYLFLS